MYIGIDLGGTKIAGVVLDEDGVVQTEARRPTPQGDYGGTLEAIAELIQELEAGLDMRHLPIGIGTPGTLDPVNRTLRGCNSTCLNGQAFAADLEARLGRRIAISNDANCLALSEAHDGAARGAHSVFAVILGTGVGGGLVLEGRVQGGAHGIAGEWGHNPLPQPRKSASCWCGRQDCIEAHLSGPALAKRAGVAKVEDLAALIASAESEAVRHYRLWLEDLSRALALVINIVDPEVIVFGGGVSRLPELCAQLPELVLPHVFAPQLRTRLLLSQHGAASGVRGAARLGVREGADQAAKISAE